ncbi:MAG: DUF2157 domain-containing protein [Helicobacteraceae bacterium]|jgi:uncharacterized membrane protein|nr:DUF2157 domain-containing protein [Helicobacteraceae bacterium]
MKTPIDWLENEVSEWAREQIISAESAAKILARYQNDAPKTNWATAIFAAFGATLIALGIISLFAFNWEELTRGAKGIVALLLLTLAQSIAIYAKLKKPQSAAHAEGASLFLLLAFTGALAIVAQTYHLGGNAIDFTKVVIALTLPLIYIFNSKGASAILFIAIAALICVLADGGEPQALGWIYMAAWFPWYVLRLIYRRDSHATQAFNLLFMFGALAIMNAELAEYIHGAAAWIYQSLFFAAFWLASALAYPNHTGFFKRPAEEIAKLAIALMLLTASVDGAFYWWGYGDDREYQIAPVFYLASALYFALFGFFVVKLRERLWELIVPIAPLIFYAALSAEMDKRMIWFFSFACLIGGAAFIFGGVRRLNTTLAYQGIVWLAALFAIRFFDSDLGFIEKGVGFIVVGIAFLATNVLIRRYIKDAK